MQAGAWGVLLAEPQALKQRMRDAGPSGGASVRETLPSCLGFVPTLGRTGSLQGLALGGGGGS